jgi:hypothetical protein
MKPQPEVHSLLTQGSKRNLGPKVLKTQHGNLNMKNQGNVSPPNSHCNYSTSEFKDNELAEMLERKFRSLLLKMTRDLKEY